MSYIHEALKKAQNEKDALATRYANFWSTYRGRGHVLKREWLISSGLFLVAVVLSAYSWLYALDQRRPAHHATNRASVQMQSPTRVRPSARAPSKITPKTAKQTPSTKNVFRQRVPSPATKPETSAKKERAAASVKRSLPRETKPPLSAIRPPQNEKVTSPPKAMQSEDAKSLYAQALTLQKKGQLTEAKKLYQATITRSPQLVSAMNNLGAIYLEEGEYIEARKLFQRAIRLKSDYVDAYYNLACLHALQQERDLSVFYLKKAVSLNEKARDWAKTDEDLTALRGHSEYEKIITGG